MKSASFPRISGRAYNFKDTYHGTHMHILTQTYTFTHIHTHAVHVGTTLFDSDTHTHARMYTIHVRTTLRLRSTHTFTQTQKHKQTNTCTLLICPWFMRFSWFCGFLKQLLLEIIVRNALTLVLQRKRCLEKLSENNCLPLPFNVSHHTAAPHFQPRFKHFLNAFEKTIQKRERKMRERER